MSNLSSAYFVAALVLASPGAAVAESNGKLMRHGYTHNNARPAFSTHHKADDPPFSFACTTDGGRRPGCDDGWVYR